MSDSVMPPTIDFYAEGPMTEEEMINWMKNNQVRRLQDLCCLAMGFNPESESVKNFDYLGMGGNPQRLMWLAIQAPDLPKEKRDDVYYANRNDFIPWLRDNKTWGEYGSAIRLYKAWVKYRANSPHFDALLHTMPAKVYRVVERIKKEKGISKTRAAVLLLFKSPEYAKEMEGFVFQNGNKKGQGLDIDTLYAYCGMGKPPKGQKKSKI